MANPTALYSYKGEEPQPLPHEISYLESWGATTFRQGVETFTEEEIEKAGYTGPFERPDHDPRLEMMSWDSENMEWVKTQFEDHMFMAELRRQRYRILQDTDWTQIPDSPLTEEEKTKWANFRQALRDFSKNCPDPKNYSFPLPVDFEL